MKASSNTVVFDRNGQPGNLNRSDQTVVRCGPGRHQARTSDNRGINTQIIEQTRPATVRRLQNSLRGAQGRTLICWLTVLALALTSAAGRAQTFTTLHSFTAYPNYTNTDGAKPNGLLLSGNELYGTASDGGSSLAGTVFKLNADGTGFTTLHSFTGGSDGYIPLAGVILSGNTLYGTASAGGSAASGTVFAVNTDGSGFTILHTFTAATYDPSKDINTNSDGFGPTAGLFLLGNTLYGTAQQGGSGLGTVFAVNTDGTGFTNLHSFNVNGSDGIYPDAGLIGSGNTLYGTAIGGGTSGNGTVFALHTDGTGFTNLHSFTSVDYNSYPITNSDGAYPHAGLVLSGNVLFGTAAGGGSSGYGTVFAVNTDGTGFTNLHSLGGSDGNLLYGGLVLTNNTLYGTTVAGGSSTIGTVFAMHADGTGFTNLHSFTGSDGANPYAGLALSGNALYGTARYDGSSGEGTAFAIHIDGTGFTVLHSFSATSIPSTNSDGATPHAGVIANSSGNTLYGTTAVGGSSGHGTVFAVNTDGTGFTNLHSFNYSDGDSPGAGLLLSGNTLYGTALYGGSGNAGTVFAVHTDGTGFTNLHDFTYADGSYPDGGLVLSGNILYGTAIQGDVFAVHTDGSGFTNLHSFTGGSDGALPYGGLFLTNNTLYGTASQGGSFGGGTVFAVQTDGLEFTNLHNFAALDPNYYTNGDGAVPYAGLILSGNTLYGTASYGGGSGNGTVFAVHTDGSGFTNLHAFAPVPNSYPYTNSDGANPFAGLVLSANTLYGTTIYGGGSGRGTLFALNTDGTGFTTLHSFTETSGSYPVYANSDGAYPWSGLMLSGNTLYGTASAGGGSGNGTVFSLSFRPQLTITPSGANVILSWPISYAGFSYAGYQLQQSTDLSSSANWSVPDPTVPIIVNGQLTVTKPMSGPQLSYRLVH